ncbi:monooxygenase [Mycolicibacterium sp. CH28]|uniref:MmoB/DmpM family protein n=1 Tax=Mycolicibacterium sp. CH28 TaxID=2512237 RepID=UPI001082038A|nr:MmoB/DmpM family protein [Mycolicibacterium sp. CH28]TGD86039.1 monooxygenase [Mycolicibacterium sp. CH28]
MTTVREVGVDLQESGEDVRRMVSAIEKDNPGMRVTHLPGLIKVNAPGKLVIKRESIEDELGREWETHEFQLSIVSYYGNISDYDDDEIVISWDH